MMEAQISMPFLSTAQQKQQQKLWISQAKVYPWAREKVPRLKSLWFVVLGVGVSLKDELGQ
jgi:hypothetical protein